MPELPEVESVRRQLEPELSGRRVLAVWADTQRRFHAPGLLLGRTVEGVGRRGKFLLCPLDQGLELVLHLGMTGVLHFGVADSYARARITLDDGRELVFRDVRRFGGLAVVPAGAYGSLPTLARLGPEPLSDDFDPAPLRPRPGRHPGPGQALPAQPAAGRRGRQHLRRRGAVAVAHPPRLPPGRPPAGPGPPRRHPPGPGRRDRPRGHHLPRLPHGQRRVRPQRRLPDRLRPSRPPLPPLRHPTAQGRPRRPRHHLLPNLPATLGHAGPVWSPSTRGRAP